MKCHHSAVSRALAVLAVLGLAGPAAAQQVPFGGTLRGSFTLTPIAGTTNALVVATGMGEATQLGRFQFHFPLTVNAMQEGSGTYTFTAANGDRVFAVVAAKSELLPNGLRRVAESAIIKGGTGRFAGATGSYLSERFLKRTTGEVFGSFRGTIPAPRVNP